MANHLTQWKPRVRINGNYRIFETYSEIKRKMRELLKESDSNIVMVLRSKRGEWGEWFEYWTIQNNKPVIKRQGWN